MDVHSGQGGILKHQRLSVKSMLINERIKMQASERRETVSEHSL